MCSVGEESDVEHLIFEAVTAMSGQPPEVPLAPGISLDELTAGDQNPMFVTLEIGRVDARSRNERTYPRAVEEKVRDSIIHRRVGGIRGHLRDDERGSAHPEMVWRWVGASLDENGVLWGKAYVLPTQQQAREEIRTAKAANAAIGTSRYATGTVDENGIVEAENYYLEGIDYVHESRVGIPTTSVVPMVTSETETTEPPPREDLDSTTDLPELAEENNANMPDNTITLDEAQEQQRAAVREATTNARQRISELSRQLAEAEDQVAAWHPAIELIHGEGQPDILLRTMIREMENLKAENQELLDGYIQTKVADAVKSETVIPLLKALVKEMQPSKRTEVDSAVAEVLGRSEVKALLKAHTAAEMGPAQPASTTEPADDMTETEAVGSDALLDELWG